MPIINRIAEFHREMTEWRHDLHSHPELSFEEVETSQFIQTRLNELGMPFEANIGGRSGNLTAG